MKPKTLFEKIWDAHVVRQEPGGPALLYVDLHLVHEVTSPQAFEGLRLAGRTGAPARSSRSPRVDHNVPTTDRGLPIRDEISRRQIEALQANCEEFGIQLYGMESDRQGIVHVIGPELGYTQPGMVIVCGDSHTSTHGAFGAFAMRIGTSEVEHVLATQCLVQSKPKTMEVRVEGSLPRRRDGQGHDPGHHRPDRRGRRHRPRHRVHGRGGARALDGRADDRLQHVD